MLIIPTTTGSLTLLVQYPRGDGLFSVEGMEAAHGRIAAHHEGAGRPEAYTGEFYEGPIASIKICRHRHSTGWRETCRALPPAQKGSRMSW